MKPVVSLKRVVDYLDRAIVPAQRTLAFPQTVDVANDDSSNVE
jgi:hypothetical protein